MTAFHVLLENNRQVALSWPAVTWRGYCIALNESPETVSVRKRRATQVGLTVGFTAEV